MVSLEKEKFGCFILELSAEYSVYAPGKVGGKTKFIPVESESDIEFNTLVTDISPKGIFFPHSEVLYEYDKEGFRVPQRKVGKPIAVWGMRGCDSRGLLMLNRVFGSAIQMPDNKNFHDPYWKEKYDSSVIFGIGCNEPHSTCFCNWFEGGPHTSLGMDVFVVDAGDRFLLEPVTDKGQTALNKLSCFTDSCESDKTTAVELASKAEKSMAEPMDATGLGELLNGIYNESVWEEISAKCINCGACTFSCPTCHCFDIQDEGKGSRGKRIRIWDSCMFPVFTMEASGHNPRAISSQRVRQRVMHKYSYFPEKYGEYLCTGCGRCVTVCPVNLDIREVLKTINAYKKQGITNG